MDGHALILTPSITRKTTLLNRILTEKHNQKIAVIVNEYGEVGIDNQLVVDSEEEILEMNNGCICCTVRGDLIRILRTLVFSMDQGKVAFDRVLIETTGLADPARAGSASPVVSIKTRSNATFP